MKVSMVAMIGAGGNIGAENALPQFLDPEERVQQAQWFDALSHDSVIIMGSNTIRLMHQEGFQGVGPDRKLIVWSRKLGKSPEELLTDLYRYEAPILVAGGATVFRLFAPLCHNYYLRRVTLVNPPEHRLDPILSSWQNRTFGGSIPREPRFS